MLHFHKFQSFVANSGAPKAFLKLFWFRLPTKSVCLHLKFAYPSWEAIRVLDAYLNRLTHPLMKYPVVPTQISGWIHFRTKCFLCSFISSHKFERIKLLGLNIDFVSHALCNLYINIINWTFSDLWEMVMVSFSRKGKEQVLFLATEWVLITHIKSTRIYTAIGWTLKLVNAPAPKQYVYASKRPTAITCQ